MFVSRYRIYLDILSLHYPVNLPDHADETILYKSNNPKNIKYTYPYWFLKQCLFTR